jgi:fructose-bisphosphate aldolase class 1
LFILQVILSISMENHGGIISTDESPDSSTRALWKSYQQSHPVASRKNRRKMINFQRHYTS